MHRGDQCRFGRFTGRTQALIERPRYGIAPHRSNRGEVQDPAQPFTSSLDFALPAQRAAVEIERRYSRQRGELAYKGGIGKRAAWRDAIKPLVRIGRFSSNFTIFATPHMGERTRMKTTIFCR